MRPPRIPDDEPERLAALHALELLETVREERFDRLTRLACRLFDVPIAALSLVDANREWFKSCVGVSAQAGARETSFCGHAILEDTTLVIPDARVDERFADNPQVVDDGVQFYAGQSLRAPDGQRIGAFCIKDRRPRQLSPAQLDSLQTLASAAETELLAVGVLDLKRELGARSERLGRAEEDRDRFFTHSLDMLSITGFDGYFQQLNPRWHEVLGWSDVELCARPFFDFIHPDDLESTVFEAGRLMEGAATVDFENRYRRKDGGYRWLRWTASVSLERQLYFAIARDVTDERRAVDQLRSANEHLDAVVQSAADGIITMDGQGLIRTFNPAAETIFGYRPDETVGQSLKMLMPEPFFSGSQERLLQVIGAEVGQMVGKRREVAGRRKDGSVFPLELSVSVMGQGAARHYLGITRDATDRKRAEQAVARQTMEARMLHQTTTLAADGDSVDEILRHCLGVVRTLTGWPVGHAYLINAAGTLLEPSGIWSLQDPERFRPFQEVTHRTTFALGIGLPGRVWASAKPAWIPNVQEDQNFPRARSTTEIAVRGAFAFPVVLRGAVTAVLEFYTDTTVRPDEHLLMVVETVGVQVGRIIERKEAEHRMQEAKLAAEIANQSKSDFLASMSHELRTPLNSVIGFANVLLRNKAGRLVDRDLNFLERIRDNGAHLLGLINDVLDISKIEAGRRELESGPVDLGALARAVLGQCEGQAHAKALLLKLELPTAITPIDSDDRALRQILINLVGNAIKFTEEGHVRIRVQSDRTTSSPLAIEVEDTGIGIPADKLDVIFEPFQQAEVGTSRRFGGTGLGLAISRSLCQLLGYQLEVESEVGRGTVFRIRLPAAQYDDRAPVFSHTEDLARSPAPPRDHQGADMLIVEDDPEFGDLDD